MTADAELARDGAQLRFRWATPRTALSVGVFTLLLLAACIPLAWLSRADKSFLSTILSTVVVIPFALLGFVLARRLPCNPIGWILLFFAPAFIVSTAAGMYAILAYRVDHHDLPLSRLAVVLAPSWVLLQVVAPLPILLFPDGRITTRRWKWTLWAFLAIVTLWVGTILVVRGSVVVHQHPVRLDAAAQSSSLDEDAHGLVAGIQHVVQISYIALVLLWVFRLIVIYRGSVGDLRQQLKWLMVGGALCVVGIIAGGLLNGAAVFLGVLVFPVCVGIAILKYRLYDIDRLISRTVSYAIVTGLLIGVYVGLVSLLTRALPLSSPVGVAASTLAVAALFNPVRRRAQRLVDRRFNRARYDAEATIAGFTAALRNEIDVDLVQRDLVEVVIRSVQPAHVTVWIRSPP